MPGIFLVTESGQIMGNADASRLNALPWYKKLLAKISRKYRNKYIDIRPFKFSINKNQ